MLTTRRFWLFEIYVDPESVVVLYFVSVLMWCRESCHCDKIQNNEDSAFECVPFGLSTDLLTGASGARLERGGWIPPFGGSEFHKSVVHGVAKPKAKTVGA
jgi:hypothetical protein